MSDGPDFRDAQFLATIIAYTELVRELVDRGHIERESMVKRLGDAEAVIKETLNDEVAARCLAMFKKPMTPK